MPVTLKQGLMKYKNGQGEYVGINTVGETGTAQQLAAISSAGTTQVANVNQAGTTQTQAVNTAGNTQVQAVNTAGSNQVTAVNNKGQEVLDSIPADYSELSDDVDSLKSAINDKAPVIISSASGAIASFSDGADGLPVKELTVGIEPVQDLHGYDSPWPAGGGVNKLNVELPIVLSEAGNIGQKPCVLSAGTYTFTSQTNVAAAYSFTVFNSSGTRIAIANTTGSSASPLSVTFTISEESAYIMCYYNVACTVTNMQIEVGTSFSGTFVPYSNICPISGFDSVKMIRTGKNLWNPEITHRTALNLKIGGVIASGTVLPDGSLILPAGTYIISVSESMNGIYIAGATGKNIAVAYSKTTLTFTVPTKQACSIMLYKLGATIDYWDTISIQLELGSTATDYEPYSGQTYSITLPSEAGTVYGGSLTVNEDGTGQVVVDRVYALLNKPASWGKNSGTIDFIYAERFNNRRKTAESFTGLICSYIQVVSGQGETGRWSGAASDYFGIKSSILTIEKIREDAEAGKIAICYYLATPQTYTLTASQVQTLLGTNNIWADAGDVVVEYRADTKLYIEQLTKPTEDDMTANTAITSGKFFMIGNRLFLATAAIASGATIIPGTNCTELSLADALNNINA